MKFYRKMMIKKSNIMLLIQDLAKAYNNLDDEYVVLDLTHNNWFLLFDENDNQIAVKPKPKCGECKYLDIDGEMSVVGYKCNRPNFKRMWDSAAWKRKSCPACKGFERRE